MSETTSFWHWPGWRQLLYATGLGLAEALLFAVVYGGTDWLAGQHTYRVRLHTAFDLTTPLVPAATIAYLSLNLLLWVPAFVLRTRHQLRAFVAALATATVVAGVCFIVFPGESARELPTADELGIWREWFEFARTIALTYNFAPSLHVAFTTITVLVLLRHARSWGRWLLSAWGAAIIASTLLTHQHYLIDVITGLLLGFLSVKYCYDRLIARQQSSLSHRARPIQSSDPKLSA